LLHNISSSLTSTAQGELSQLESSLAHQLGLQDFYSAHLMDYCQGSFTPGPVPNATLSRGSIHKNVTSCSNRTAMFSFDPTAALQATLNETHTGVTLSDLHWPSDIENGVRALRFAVRAAFVLYCISIGFCFLSLIASSFWTSACSRGGRGVVALEILLAFLAFLSLGIASGIMTAVGVKGASIINKYGHEIGVSANWGGRFMGMTWAATGLMLVASICGCFGCCLHRNRENVKRVGGEKYRA
jgi:SUR7/PalI family